MTDISTLPLGTTDPAALLDNAKVLDQLVNGTGEYLNRKVASLPSWAEISRRYSLEPPVAYTAGLSITRVTQTVTNGGNDYHLRPEFLPYTTPAGFDSSKWVLLEGLSRAELNATGGAGQVGLLDSGGYYTAAQVEGALAEAAVNTRFAGKQHTLIGRLSGVDNNTLEFVKPDGTVLSTAGTTTGGIQEAINHAVANGYNLNIDGAATAPTVDKAIISINTALYVPPMRNMDFEIRQVHFVVNAAITGCPWRFDSMMECHVRFLGEIVYEGNDDAIKFKPEGTIPVDPQIAITDSKIEIMTVACVGGAPLACIGLEGSAGSIIGNTWKFTELNGSGGAGSPAAGLTGITLRPGATTEISGNQFEVAHIHDVKNVGIQDGSGSNPDNVRGNTFNVGIIATRGASAEGVNCFSKGEVFNVGIIEKIPEAGSNLVYGIKYQPDANENRHYVNVMGGTSSGIPVLDLGRDNSGWRNGTEYLDSWQIDHPMSPNTGGRKTSYAATGGATYAAADMVGGIIYVNVTGAITQNTDSATNIVAKFAKRAGSFFRLKVVNTGSANLTIGAGSGVGFVGNTVIAGGTSKDLIVIIDNVATPAVTICM